MHKETDHPELSGGGIKKQLSPLEKAAFLCLLVEIFAGFGIRSGS